MDGSDDILAKLERLRTNRERIQAENRKKLKDMGVLGFIEAARDAFGEVRLEGAISREPPYFVGDRDRMRRWWQRIYGRKG